MLPPIHQHSQTLAASAVGWGGHGPRANGVDPTGTSLGGNSLPKKETRHQLLGLFIRPLTKIYSQENYLYFGEFGFDQKYGYGDGGGLHI